MQRGHAVGVCEFSGSFSPSTAMVPFLIDQMVDPTPCRCITAFWCAACRCASRDYVLYCLRASREPWMLSAATTELHIWDGTRTGAATAPIVVATTTLTVRCLVSVSLRVPWPLHSIAPVGIHDILTLHIVTVMMRKPHALIHTRTRTHNTHTLTHTHTHLHTHTHTHTVSPMLDHVVCQQFLCEQIRTAKR